MPISFTIRVGETWTLSGLFPARPTEPKATSGDRPGVVNVVLVPPVDPIAGDPNRVDWDVTGLAPGWTRVTVKGQIGGEIASDYCDVTVVPQAPPSPHPVVVLTAKPKA